MPGVVGALPPHDSELLVRPGSPGAVVEIVELTTAARAALRSRHEAAPGAVWAEVSEVRALRA